MTAAAALSGYLIGSLPTAGWLGLMWGVDLRRDGSGNPGTNNARRLGGWTLATAVLVVEIGKGLLAVTLGSVIAGDWGTALAGAGAVAGNVYNVWYRFAGGKGLAIAAGVIIGAWPNAFLPVLGVIVVAVVISRSSGIAALAAILALNVLAVLWLARDLPAGPWGLEPSATYLVLSIAMGLLMFPKHLKDAIRRIGRRRNP